MCQRQFFRVDRTLGIEHLEECREACTIAQFRLVQGFLQMSQRAGQVFPPLLLGQEPLHRRFGLVQGFQHDLLITEVGRLLTGIGQIDPGPDAPEIEQRLGDRAAAGPGERRRAEQVFQVRVLQAQERGDRNLREQLGECRALRGGRRGQAPFGAADVRTVAQSVGRFRQQPARIGARYRAGFRQSGSECTGLCSDQDFEPVLGGGQLTFQ